MAIVELEDLDSLRRSLIDEGLYPAKIVKCEIQPLRSDPNQRKVYWEFRTEDCEDPKNNGRHFISHTSIEPGKGDVYLKYVEGLGLDPTRFDCDGVIGDSVMIQIAHKQGKDQAGDPRTEERVTQLRPRA